MDENLHSIDHIFKNAIEDLDVSPSAKVYEELEKHLEKKHVVSITQKYKRWKWVAAALLIFSVGMAMYTYQLNQKYSAATIRLRQKNTPVAADKSSKENTFADTSPPVETPLKPTGNTAIQPDNDNNKVNKAKINSQSSAVTKRDRKDRSLVKGKSGNFRSDSFQGGAEKHTIGSTKKGVVKLKEQHKIIAVKSNMPYKVNIIGNKAASFNEYRTGPKITYLRKMPLVGGNTDTIKQIPLLVGEQSKMSLLMDKINSGDFIASHQQTSLQIQPAPALQKASVPDFKSLSTLPSKGAKTLKVDINRNSGFSANVFYSTDRIFTRLDNRRGHFREDDKDRIKNDEQQSIAHSAGVLVQKRVGTNISLQMGFNLSTRITDIAGKTIYARADNRGRISYRVSCSSGYAYIASKIGAQPNQGDSITSAASKNTLKYLSIPVGLQYHVIFGKFTFAPGIMFSTNIKTREKFETELVGPGNNEKVVTNKVEGLKSVYFDAGPRLDMIYNLSKTIGIGLSPSARFALSPATNDGPVKTYINAMGIAASITFKL